MNRQKLILIVLGVLFVAAVISSILRFPRQKKVEKLTYGPGSTAAAVPRATGQQPSASAVGAVRIELLERTLEAHPVKRDLLNPIFVDEARATAQKAARMKKVKPPPPPPPPPPPTAQEIARSQLRQFRSLGMLRKAGRQTAFLARGEEIVLVRIGDSPIAGYKASAITDDTLTLRGINDNDEITFPLR